MSNVNRFETKAEMWGFGKFIKRNEKHLPYVEFNHYGDALDFFVACNDNNIGCSLTPKSIVGKNVVYATH